MGQPDAFLATQVFSGNSVHHVSLQQRHRRLRRFHQLLQSRPQTSRRQRRRDHAQRNPRQELHRRLRQLQESNAVFAVGTNQSYLQDFTDRSSPHRRFGHLPNQQKHGIRHLHRKSLLQLIYTLPRLHLPPPSPSSSHPSLRNRLLFPSFSSPPFSLVSFSTTPLVPTPRSSQ